VCAAAAGHSNHQAHDMKLPAGLCRPVMKTAIGSITHLPLHELAHEPHVGVGDPAVGLDRFKNVPVPPTGPPHQVPNGQAGAAGDAQAAVYQHFARPAARRTPSSLYEIKDVIEDGRNVLLWGICINCTQAADVSSTHGTLDK
jgi:hypothetical protein